MTVILRHRIFSINNNSDFLDAALEIYEYQSVNNQVFRDYISYYRRKSIKTLLDIPFLPVGFFRNHMIVSGNRPVEMIFESSGTTSGRASRHYVSDLSLYEESFISAFRIFYGEPSGYCIVSLLPSYTERKNSSLVYMMNRLIEKSGYPGSGFYKDDPEHLIAVIRETKSTKKNVLLLGVTFALLDLALNFSPDLKGIIVMETGGMKGRRKELTREELYSILKDRLNITCVHSEYGMTELMSQAYSKGEGIFYTPPWMKILIRDPHDPLSVSEEPGITGGINIIDLANINSCSFIETGDLGRLRHDGGFEVLGRFDNSDLRGCNLMME
jgi:hypothetical protein